MQKREYELKRLQRQLEDIERHEQNLRGSLLGTGLGAGRPKRVLKQELAFYDSEKVAAEARLKTLAGGEE